MSLSWSDRLTRLPMTNDDLVEGLAEAVYMTHWREPAPEWKHAADSHKDWSRAQARAALAYLRSLTRPGP